MGTAVGTRDFRVDAIRGFVLIWMTWSHLPPFPFRGFLVQTFGIVNAAEVFVFASGLVTAWLLTRLLETSGLRAVVRRSLTRAGQLYVTHLAMLAVLLWLVGEGIVQLNVPAQSNPVRLFLRGACLIFQPDFLDILPMYVCFLIAAPFVVTQLAKARHLLVAVVSFGLWMASWYVPVGNHQTFNVLAWQFMFISGMIAGHWRLTRGKPTSPTPLAIAICCAITLIFGVLGRPDWFGLGRILGHPLQYELVFKHVLTPTRLLNFAAMVTLVVSVPRSCDMWIPRSVYRGLVMLGQSSLQIFVWSVAISYSVRIKFLDWYELSKTEQFVMVWIFAFSLFIPALLHKAMRSHKRTSGKVPIGLPASTVFPTAAERA